MSVHQVRKAAEEMGVPFKVAAWCRCRYLTERIRQQAEDVKSFSIFIQSGDAWDAETVALHMRLLIPSEVVSAEKELQALTLLINGHERKQAITDGQIQTARDYPIDRIITFHKGLALAPCHADKSPSLHWDRKRNRAHCFVCGKSFSGLDYLIEFEGLKFVDAVLQLAA